MYSSNGYFSTKSAYLLACGWDPNLKDEGWEWIWKTSTHPRIQYHLWICYHGKLFTVAHLAHQGIQINPTCAICKAHDESIEHLFRECPIAINFWRKLGIPQSKRATFRTSFKEWVRVNCLAYEKHSMNIPWRFIFPQALWLLWKQRNEAVFNKGKLNERLHDICLQQATEFYALSMAPDKEKKRQVLVGWSPPPGGFFKLNTDGSVSKNPGRAGVGGLIRDHNGRWIGGFGRPLGITNSLMAEAWALREGLCLARRLGIQDLCIELDAKVLFNLIWGEFSSNMHLFHIISDCRQLYNEFKECRTSLIYKEANEAADFLAKKVRDDLSTDDGLLYWENPPPGICNILLADYLGAAYPRFTRSAITM